MVRSTLFPQFELVDVYTSWGLLVFMFHRPSGSARVPLLLDTLSLTDGTVINDMGQEVHRWSRLADEMLKYADRQSRGDSILLPA